MKSMKRNNKRFLGVWPKLAFCHVVIVVLAWKAKHTNTTRRVNLRLRGSCGSIQKGKGGLCSCHLFISIIRYIFSVVQVSNTTYEQNHAKTNPLSLILLFLFVLKQNVWSCQQLCLEPIDFDLYDLTSTVDTLANNTLVWNSNTII